jgi:Protein of unknown function (DUF1479)
MPAGSAARSATELLDRVGRTPADIADLLRDLRRRVELGGDAVVATHGNGLPVFPEIAMADVVAGTVGAASVAEIRATGCAVVRGTFERDEAEAWDVELADYLARNAFRARFEAANVDAATGSRIWGVYWSRPQVLARQHPRMASVRGFLNGLWRAESLGTRWFDPATDVAYPDRVRRREPGANSRGLASHVDSPSVGGWRLLENQRVFAPMLRDGAGAYDPWDAAHRTGAGAESPVGCTVFRTFQGWTALSDMHPSDGVLHVVPLPGAVAYRLVHGLATELGLLGDPSPAPVRDRGDALIDRALVPIPAVGPGDTVWWHGDLYHSVADAANDTRWGNVMYIGAAPRCARNDVYRADMFDRFARGASPRDFPAEDFEVEFEGRATPDDLTPLGREQFGLDG